MQYSNMVVSFLFGICYLGFDVWYLVFVITKHNYLFIFSILNIYIFSHSKLPHDYYV